MAVDKLPEFAKDGQKNTENLNQEEGFPVNLKPARQWFNFLFNKLSLAINQIIDEDYIRHNELVDDLVTDVSNKPLSAKQGKALQDNKLEISRNLSDLKSSEVARKNLSLDKFAQNPNQNTAVGAPNVDAAIIITNTGWGVYKNSSVTNFDPALPINYGGTGATSIASAKANLQINKFVQDPSVTSIYSPTTDSRIVITDNSWGIWSVDPAFNTALSAAHGGTGRTDGKAQALVAPRTVQFSGSATGSFSYDGSANSSCILTLANSGVVASTYGSALKIPTITVNQQGLITGVSEKEVTKANLSLDKFTQNPNQNTAVGAPNVDAAIIITNTGWGVYKNSSATNFDPALPTLNGGTGRTDGKAQALVTPRTVQFSGSATGSFSYDGSANSSCILTLANSGVVASTYGSALKIPTITVNQQGLITGVSEKEVTKANLSLDKFTQNPNQNTAVGAPNVDAAIIITNTGWGVYKNSSVTNFDPALPINYGGTGATSIASAKANLQINKFVQDPSVTSIYSPTTDSRIVITDNSWGIWSVDPAFNTALSAAHGGTGNTQGIAPSAAKLQTARNIALSGAVSGSANFDGSGNINIGVSLQAGLGVNQWWQNVTANRAINTSYYNGTGSPIMINVGFDDTDTRNPTITIVVNGVVIIDQKYDGGTNFGTGQYCFVVPNASYYSVNNTTVNSHKIWSELR